MKIQTLLELTVIECGGCGITFAVPEPWRQQKQDNHTGFRCPNGCSRAYLVETETEKLRRAALSHQASLNESNHLRLVAEKKLAEAVAERKRIESRVHRGVCPCCNRSFVNLGRHMKSKHASQIEGHAQKQIAGPVHA